MSGLHSVREWLGVAIHDWHRYRRAFADGVDSSHHWTRLCNRIEHVTVNPNGPGVQCEWEWGSDLHACHVWPSLGRKLMEVALRECPIRFAESKPMRTGTRVSFIIAHGGRSRLPQLCLTLKSLFAQTEIDLECVVVDQSEEPIFAELPPEIVYRHLTKAGVDQGWHKSWAYNVGARLATGEILVFHDGDICVPEKYGSSIVETLTQGRWQAASLQRVLFYLNDADTERVEKQLRFSGSNVPLKVFQNWKGGTIAIRRDAFFAIGGFDEGFVDWGGEDDEFYDRCRQALAHCRYGYLPFVHLWHPPQSDRKAADNVNINHVMPWRMGLPVVERVQELATRDFGNPRGPDPIHSYKQELQSTARSERA